MASSFIKIETDPKRVVFGGTQLVQPLEEFFWMGGSLHEGARTPHHLPLV